MKYFTTAIALILFSQAAFAQAVPYVLDYGPKTPIKEFENAGVFQGQKRILQIVNGRKYYQPYDWPLPVRPYNGAMFPKDTHWGINKSNTWTDGKEWVEAYQFQGYVSVRYTLYHHHATPLKMTEPPNPE